MLQFDVIVSYLVRLPTRFGLLHSIGFFINFDVLKISNNKRYLLMKSIKCDALFCKFNKKAGVCNHPKAQPGIMNDSMKPFDFCEDYRKFLLKSKKLKRK